MSRPLPLYSKEQKNEFSLQGKLGLINYGDSSFVNAIIQALSNIEQLCFLIRIFPSDVVNSIGCIQDVEGRKKRSDVFFALRRLLRELWIDKRVVIEPAILIRRMNQLPILKDAITNANIEDTFVYLLECLHECLQQSVPPQFEPRVNLSPGSPVWSLPTKGVGAYQRSIISDTLQGISTSVITCKSCGYVDKRMDAFLVLRIDLVKLSSRSSSAGVQLKNASSYYTKKTARKMVTEHTTDESGKNIIVTLMKRVVSMSEIPLEQSPSNESTTIPGRIMKFIRSHTKTDLNTSAADGSAVRRPSLKFSYRSNRVASDPEEEKPSKADAAAIASLNAPVEDDDRFTAPPQVISHLIEDLSVRRPHSQVISIEAVAAHKETRYDPLETKDGDDHFSLRPINQENTASTNSNGLLTHHPFALIETSNSTQPESQPQSESHPQTQTQPNHLSTPSTPKPPPSTIILPPLNVPNKKRIIKKLSNSFSEGDQLSNYKNPQEYIRQHSNPSSTLSSLSSSNPKELRSSPSLPNYPEKQSSLSRSSSNKNNSVKNDLPPLEIPSHSSLPSPSQEQKEEDIPHSAPVTPTRYERKTSMKLDSIPPPPTKTPRDHLISSSPPNLHLHSEGDSSYAHSSDSIIPEMDPFSWENIKDQVFSSIQNGADVTLNALGLRQFGSTINLEDCLKSTFSATTSTQYCSNCHTKGCQTETIKTLSCAPEVLVLYFDRFVNFGWKHTKIKNLVIFPLLNLDLSDFLDSQSSYFEGSFKQNPIYDLHVVIEHVGTDKTRNRYVTIARHEPEGKWFEYDDHLVREISEKNLGKREVLFLFYIQKKKKGNITHGDCHLPLEKIQEMCHEMLEKRYEKILLEKKYFKNYQKKKKKMKNLNLNFKNKNKKINEIEKNEENDGTAQDSHSADPRLSSEKTDKAVGNEIEAATSQQRYSKWNIVRENLAIIREMKNSPKQLKVNSKWLIIQRNLSKILEMRGTETEILKNETVLAQEQGGGEEKVTTNQIIPLRGRKSFNEFLQTSFRRSEKFFLSSNPLPRSSSTTSPFTLSPSTSTPSRRRNIFHSLLKSSIFTVLYLDDNDIHVENPDPNLMIPDTLPPIDDLNLDSSYVYISSYWLMKFLSFSNPGQLCNHDIACSHGYLKPHLHGCKKYICVPISITLLIQIESYLFEEFNYPLFVEQSLGIKSAHWSGSRTGGSAGGTGGAVNGTHIDENHDAFRYLKAMTPCVLCSDEYEKLLQRRSNELEQVMIEHIRDGYEDPLPEQLHDEVLKETYTEAKRQNRLTQLQQKRKITATNSRLHRLGLLTRTQLAFTSAWKKKQTPPSSPSALVSPVGFDTDTQIQPHSEQSLSNENNSNDTKKHINDLIIQPKPIPQDSSSFSSLTSLNSTRKTSSLLLAAKIARKISSSTSSSRSKSRVIFSSYSPNDPILAIRPLSEIPFCCMIHSGWFNSWKRYIQSGLFEDIEYPILDPGPITNYLLLKHSSRYRSQFIKKKSIHYLLTSQHPPSSPLTIGEVGGGGGTESETTSPTEFLQRESTYARLQSFKSLKQPGIQGSGGGGGSMGGIGSPITPIEASPVVTSRNQHPSSHPKDTLLPSTIVNELLRKDLHLNHNYVVISPNVWKILFNIYGGGPAIFREDVNIYSDEYDLNGNPCPGGMGTGAGTGAEAGAGAEARGAPEL